MLMMTRNEAIPIETMHAGMKWDWETIPEYLDSLDRAPQGINCIQYLPTASLMVYVIGLEAAKSRPATEAERAEMRRLLAEGMENCSVTDARKQRAAGAVRQQRFGPLAAFALIYWQKVRPVDRLQALKVQPCLTRKRNGYSPVYA